MKAHKHVTRLLAASAAVGTAVSGLLLATAGPAAAATGTWVPYGDNNLITTSSSRWVCAVRTQNGTGPGVQGAVIVRNDRSSLFRVEAAVDLSLLPGGFIDRWTCSRSGVGADSWSVCFSETLSFPTRDLTARGGADGVNLGVSPLI